VEEGAGLVSSVGGPELVEEKKEFREAGEVCGFHLLQDLHDPLVQVALEVGADEGAQPAQGAGREVPKHAVGCARRLVPLGKRGVVEGQPAEHEVAEGRAFFVSRALPLPKHQAGDHGVGQAQLVDDVDVGAGVETGESHVLVGHPQVQPGLFAQPAVVHPDGFPHEDHGVFPQVAEGDDPVLVVEGALVGDAVVENLPPFLEGFYLEGEEEKDEGAGCGRCPAQRAALDEEVEGAGRGEGDEEKGGEEEPPVHEVPASADDEGRVHHGGGEHQHAVPEARQAAAARGGEHQQGGEKDEHAQAPLAEVQEVFPSLDEVGTGSRLGVEGIGEERGVGPHAEDLVAADEEEEGEQEPEDRRGTEPFGGRFGGVGQEEEGREHGEVGPVEDKERSEQAGEEGPVEPLSLGDALGVEHEQEVGESGLKAGSPEVDEGGDADEHRGGRVEERGGAGGSSPSHLEEKEVKRGEGGQDAGHNGRALGRKAEPPENGDHGEPEGMGEAFHPFAGIEHRAQAVEEVLHVAQGDEGVL